MSTDSGATRLGVITSVTPTLVLLDGDSAPLPADVRIVHPGYLTIGARVLVYVQPLRWGSSSVRVLGLAGGVEPPLAISPTREWWWGDRDGYGPVDLATGATITPPGAALPGGSLLLYAGATYRYHTSVQVGLQVGGYSDALAVVQLVVGGVVLQEASATPARLPGGQEIRSTVVIERVWKALQTELVGFRTDVTAATEGVRVMSQQASPYSSVVCLGYGSE